MFGPPGHAYVYLIYGMHHCVNAVTEAEGYPAAVLIRGLDADPGVEERTDGPGRLCKALGIDRGLNGVDLTRSGDLYVTAGKRGVGLPRPEGEVCVGARIGVGYAGEWADAPLRFWLRRATGGRGTLRSPGPPGHIPSGPACTLARTPEPPRARPAERLGGTR